MAIARIAPAELKRRLDAGERFVLLDVREPAERALCSIAGSVAIPLAELPRRAAELDAAAPTVCICHHGVRSANAAAALGRLGFAQLYNLTGGIERWAQDVEPAMRRY